MGHTKVQDIDQYRRSSFNLKPIPHPTSSSPQIRPISLPALNPDICISSILLPSSQSLSPRSHLDRLSLLSCGMKLNQIITGSANAETHVLYNPNISTRGAALVMSKAPKRRHIDDDPTLTTDLAQGMSGESIVNPNGLHSGTNQGSTSYAARHPTVGLTASGRSRDPRRPHVPMTTRLPKASRTRSTSRSIYR
jgi:hypothetical protein